MAYNLTATNAGLAYNSSGKFGSSLSAYAGTCANPFPTGGTFTVEIWVKTTSSSGIQVACGANGTGWLGINAGKPAAHYGFNGTEVTLAGTSSIADGVWHHLRLVVDPSGGKFFVDGALAASSSVTASGAGAVYTNTFGVHTFGGVTGYDWVGEVDECAIFSTALSSTSFTPPSAAYADTTANLAALWHLDGNLNDSATAAAAPGIACGAVTQSSASATLTTQVALSASAATPASASGALATQVALATDSKASANASSALATQVALSASAASVTTSSTALATQIQLAADARASSLASASLTVGAVWSTSASTGTSAAASLTTSVSLGASTQTPSSTDTALSTAIALTAAAVSKASSAATLTTQVALAAVATAAASSSASLATSIALSATSTAPTRAIAALTTQIAMTAGALLPSPLQTYTGQPRNRIYAGQQRIRQL